jgi:hypothetical protein
LEFSNIRSVPLPETIPVRFTEEEAEYVSIRPVRRQTFKLRELVDMILSVTGRDLPRVQQILRTGTIVFHFYRYWWQGFETDATEISAVLAEFPVDDPSREFSADECTTIVLESAVKVRQSFDVNKKDADHKSLFASQSFWGCLLALAEPARKIKYGGYSFARHADLYRVELNAEQTANLQRNAAKFASRAQRGATETLGTVARVVFVCPRSGGAGEGKGWKSAL